MKIRLDHLVHQCGLAESRTQAAALIMAGKVRVDGVRRDKPGWQTDAGADLSLEAAMQYVSRAGLKLASVNAKFGVDFKRKTVLDVGSSTGGFSDYALQQGATKVYAVDVGTNQLHERIRANSRVVVMEQTDIRVAQLPETVDIVVIDVSFISLRQVLPYIARFVAPQGIIMAMCKPQFEAGVAEASKHKGVIKNDTIRRRILKEFELWLKQHGFIVIDKADSAVAGAKGNIERFYLIKPAT
ncbi:MAG: TlyA family RNA methyltransferase [Candidatus Saccharimonadales bacterium]